MSVEGFSYDYVLTMPNGEEITHKMWVKGNNMRLEMENPVGGEPILSIMNEEGGMPLRIETTSGSDTVVVEFLNFTIGNVEDVMFQLPPGAEIMDAGNM